MSLDQLFRKDIPYKKLCFYWFVLISCLINGFIGLLIVYAHIEIFVAFLVIKITSCLTSLLRVFELRGENLVGIFS